MRAWVLPLSGAGPYDLAPMARGKVTNLKGWKTSKQFEYSPDHFYTDCKDPGSEKQNVQAGFPSSLMREVDEMLAAREFPDLRTRGDVLRDALYHRLRYLRECKPNPSSSLVLAYLQMDRHRALQVNEAAMLHSIKTGLRDAEDADKRADLIRALQSTFPRLDGPTRRKIEEVIRHYE